MPIWRIKLKYARLRFQYINEKSYKDFSFSSNLFDFEVGIYEDIAPEKA